MQIPVLRGIIDRRILVNYRVDPEVLSRLLPRPFRPKLVDGSGIAGICLIRLNRIRPRFAPLRVGITSENAAHRIAVEWDQGEGVYIPRRDTSSWLNSVIGGRLFPGVHHHARFQVREGEDRYRVVLASDDRRCHLLVEGQVASALPGNSVFGTLSSASAFFERGSLGYSTTARPGEFDGMELRCFGWRVEPLDIEEVESSFFADVSQFPAGSVTFDCALLMRRIEHEWHAKEPIHNVRGTSAAGSPLPSSR
jgi:Uncharacterized conserved protein (COG2071)